MVPPTTIPEGRTDRLILRPLSLEDAPQIQRLFPQWKVVKYLAAKIPWPYPSDGAEQFIRDSALPAMERGEAWHWSLRLRTDPDQVIGLITLTLSEDENRGFWLDPNYRGHGYMTEACAWANDFWFDKLAQARLRAPKAVANRGSRRISQRMGMRVIHLEPRDYVSGRLPSEIWEITAEEWQVWKLLHPMGLAPAGKPVRAPAKSVSAARKHGSTAARPR
ncbi:GNAT family N-acetyltransferase [Occallatibacter riparius]|uniref:GNAT family N-acetyltransferase n=1 Tax=Occallatibacter riparius TaxID=1002689 RepID=A0A9J7BI90_9BACT|nr:GNAT family N-acetyltransferase [Occallatibacter riparius]UWZ82187.1 GNAT family N-acetyltransferase [Occallatibacter riparius]